VYSSSILFLFFICPFISAWYQQAQVVNFLVSYDKPAVPFPHYWEQCVGSGHALLSLRQDWREQLTRCHNELGFKMVRFHGLLDDDMSTSLDEGVNSFLNMDSMIDFLLSIDMRPILEISFMPSWLASGPQTGNITPPKDYGKWGALMKTLAKHLYDRYGSQEIPQFYIEVWNEPGVAPTFWTGTKEDYFHLYQETANAFKSVSPLFKVGGPATDCCAAWIQDLRDFCKTNNVSIDFVSTHTYSGGETDIGDIGPIIDALKKSKQQAGPLPLVITEWSSSYVQDWRSAIHDEPASAPFLVASMEQAAGLADVFSYWAFTDVFEEAGMPHVNISFYGGFGLLNFYGVPKPAYRAFQLLHQGGNQKVAVTKSPISSTSVFHNQNGVLASTCSQTTGILALSNNTDILLLGYNHDTWGVPMNDCMVNITVAGLKSPQTAFANARLIRIDSQNTNPKAKWIQMGSPDYLSKQQIEVLEIASRMIPKPLSTEGHLWDNKMALTFSITFPQRGLTAITIPLT